MLLAAVIGLLGLAGAVGANRVLYPDIENPEVDKAIAEAIGTGTSCMAPDAAAAALRQRLDDHGLQKWTVETRPVVVTRTWHALSVVASGLKPGETVVVSAAAGRGIYGVKGAGCRGDDPAGAAQLARNAGANRSAAHFSRDVGVVVAAERGWVARRCPSLNPFDISA